VVPAILLFAAWILPGWMDATLRMISKRIGFSLFLPAFLMMVIAGAAHAQVAPAAYRSPLSLTAGGMVSVFKPDYTDNKLGGVGAYVDLTIYHGLGVEAEGRWQRFNEFEGISQDNYLIGPRYKIRHWWRLTPYVKALGGFSNMNFGEGTGYGRFTTVAFGGGVDLRVTKRISVRAFDAEYQRWPTFLGSSLSPYGASVGVSYRIF